MILPVPSRQYFFLKTKYSTYNNVILNFLMVALRTFLPIQVLLIYVCNIVQLLSSHLFVLRLFIFDHKAKHFFLHTILWLKRYIYQVPFASVIKGYKNSKTIKRFLQWIIICFISKFRKNAKFLTSNNKNSVSFLNGWNFCSQ